MTTLEISAPPPLHVYPANSILDSTDCNDTDNSVFPNAPEICDGLINACGSTLPINETDDDSDGYVDCTIDNNGWDGVPIVGGEDCNDADFSINREHLNPSAMRLILTVMGQSFVSLTPMMTDMVINKGL